MIIDVNFQDDVPIVPAVMLHGLCHLVHSLESNLQCKPNAPFISMGGVVEKGRAIFWLHFHTDEDGQLECRVGLDRDLSGDRHE